MKTTAMFIGPLNPDLPDRDSQGLNMAVNCIPLAKSYGPFKDHVPDMEVLPDPCVGARSVQSYALVGYSYAGTLDQIYQRTGDTWTARGRDTPGDYTAAYWEFLSFNDDIIT
ncbi:unnamed protein product [marine sediment metagenome]|uniref:Uncharacterized protein n=1 Tax=marine sediment metagenome TaxID=412755 RepID=X1R0A9_9ZZZZ